MEGEKILMAVGATAAMVTAAFVFWGPTGLYSFLIDFFLLSFELNNNIKCLVFIFEMISMTLKVRHV